jgi:flagellar motor protein MotB
MKFRRRRRIETGSGPSGNTGQMMNLSLFIMLLAFFIVLNSMSSFEEEKMSKVKQSLDVAFSTDVQKEDIAPSLKDDLVQSLSEGDTFDRLEVLFSAQIPSFKTTKNRSQGVMMVQVDYDEFSKALSALGQVDMTRRPTRLETRKNFFLPTLVSLLQANIDGAPTRLEIYLHIDKNPARQQNQSPQTMVEAIDEVTVFSRDLQKRGMPEKLLNIGIAKGDPNVVNLVFRKYVPFSPVEEEE